MDTLSEVILKNIYSYLDSTLDILCLSLTCKHLLDLLPKLSNGSIVLDKSIKLVRSDYVYTLSPPLPLSSRPEDNLPSSMEMIYSGEYQVLTPLESLTVPPGVSKLTFGYWFEQPIVPGALPPSITSIKFDSRYDKLLMLGSLPTALASLTLGEKYNQPIGRGVLPDTLTYLSLNKDYKHMLETGTLPASLITLEIWGDDSMIAQHSGVFPPKLQSLMIISIKRTSTLAMLPPTLKKLKSNSSPPFTHGSLPSSLTDLSLGENYDSDIRPGDLPNMLSHLSLGWYFNRVLQPGALPSSLTSLTFDYFYNQPLSTGVLPTSLATLVFGGCFNQAIGLGVLPHGLTSLTFGAKYNQSIIPGALPNTLQSLTFGGEDFNQPFEIDSLPNSLINLTLSYFFNQTLAPGLLPTGLQSLTLGNSFNQMIGTGCLPNTLTYLKLGDDYSKVVDKHALPASLRHLDMKKFAQYKCFKDALIASPIDTLGVANGMDHSNTMVQIDCSLNRLQVGPQRMGHSLLYKQMVLLTPNVQTIDMLVVSKNIPCRTLFRKVDNDIALSVTTIEGVKHIAKTFYYSKVEVIIEDDDEEYDDEEEYEDEEEEEVNDHKE
ncbi:hypothetical protein SAMD00019534_008450 [Acytostelium subglobosum LB1]|uniref:hypothetical protein n=1 Tax=Acytostelium subglobosum LB1 TaxID=1410327 RepID=UPI000644F5FE|nr:hypothetical protein SAMD00019534_008450 [Acytostelium subglobosum LB1]GAM17670.1 hypothetical protein SAMD00019534_008450 [Acytostelium subglobosum LB1]|eukprot:XP_012758266.1 hypothetical protein SAMD00019534_008450 [Acytostelium subglobosum LB1]